MDAGLGIPEKTEQHGHFLSGKRLLRNFKIWNDSPEKAIEREIADLAWEFYHGDQWTEAQRAVLKKREQPEIWYNEVRKKVNGFVGVEENMRRDPKAFPRGPSPKAESHSDVATKTLRYIFENNNFNNISKKSAQRGCIGGVGGVEFDIVKRGDQNTIKLKPIKKNSFFYDPRCEEEDFSDSKYLGTHKWVDIEDAKALMPGKTKEIDAIAEASKTGDESSLETSQDKSDLWVSFKKESIYLIEHWYKNNGKWHCAYHCGNQILDQWVSPFIDDEGESDHRYEVWSPHVDAHGIRYGIVKDMVPIQRAINQRSSKLLHMLNTRQTIGEVGAVEDIDEAKRELHKADGHVEVHPGMRFDVIPNSDQVSGQMSLLQNDLQQMDRFGPNNALIGRGTENQSGVAIQEQKVSGVTELSPELQEMKGWKIRCYRKGWNIARQFWTEERFIRVTDDEDSTNFITLNKLIYNEETQEVELDNSLKDMDVDIILDEGPDTLTMQNEDFKTFMEVVPFLAQSGQKIPAKAIFKASPLRNKAEIIKMIEEDEAKASQNQQQQQMQELQFNQLKLKNDELVAKIEEVFSKTELNRSRAMRELQTADAIDGQDFSNQIPLGPEQGQPLEPVPYRDPTVAHPDQWPDELYQ